MKGTKYLSDVLDTSLFEKGVMNVIEAPCGCGKTTCAINRIAPLASSPRKALYLIDTKNGCQRLSQEEKLTTPYLWYPETIAGKYFNADRIDDKVVVATYARFGVWVSQYPNFTDNFEIIICDEAHNMVQFATFSEEPNYASIARNAIRDAVLIGKTTIIAITATTEYLRKLPCPQKDIPIDRENLHHYTEKEVIHYASIEQVLRAIPQDKRGALYTMRIGQMKTFEGIARAAGHNPICVWSTENSRHPMSAEQLRVREYILENEAIPDEYDLFILNVSSETAINIRSHMDYFIAHTTNETHIVQSRGRYRGDLQRLYVLDKKTGSIEVPEEYLNRRLYQADKKAMREALGIRNNKNNPLPWDELIPLLSNCGYSVIEQKADKNKHIRAYILIQKI